MDDVPRLCLTDWLDQNGRTDTHTHTHTHTPSVLPYKHKFMPFARHTHHTITHPHAPPYHPHAPHPPPPNTPLPPTHAPPKHPPFPTRYEAAVTALEQECIADPHLPTSHLHHALARGGWTLVLPVLAGVAEKVARRGLR